MQLSYEGKTSSARSDFFLSILFFFLLMFCVVPSFLNIGKIFLQIISVILLSSLVSFLALQSKNGLRIITLSFNIFIIVWIFFVFGWEVFLQIKNQIDGISYKGWIHFFYYDKSMTIGLVWLSIITVFTSLRIKNKSFQNKFSVKEYTSFFNTTSRVFLIYYFLLLFYSFVLIRALDAHPSTPNFIPFQMIIEYAKKHDYETFMIFFGNLLLFTPLGFYAMIIKQKIKPILLLMLPVMISSFIELSQLIFNNGNCDIDDVILNSIGFYLGISIKLSADRIISKTTGGDEKTVFIWMPYSLFNLSLL